MSFIRRIRRAVAAGMIACLLAPLATPALAWKPKTHVYLAQLAVQDAIDDGKVTIYQTDYASGRIIGALGDFEANPAIVEALRAKPAQYVAGVVGPDGYPDLMTGQQVIHPGTNPGLLGDPARGELGSVKGTDAWLTYLWRLAYGPRNADMERLRAALNRGLFGEIAPPTDTPEIRAFVAGYLTHAAGDMFMHTFVNHYSGGDFALQPDPRNAMKHVVLEGYVGLRTPEPRAATSIEGLERFIYLYMVRAYPGSELQERLLRGGTQASVPYIFSTLRNGLERDVERYDRERLERRGPSRVAYAATHGPEAEYKRAWIQDIDRGLKAWPRVSHEISLAMVYNPNGGGADIARAREVASTYVGDHLLSMAGAPDALIATAQFISSIINAILPSFMLAPLEALKKELLNWLVKEATGMTPDEIKDYLNHPETKFDPVMNAPGGGYGGREATLTTLADFNRNVLKIDDPAYQYPDRKFDPNTFAPAFNTIQMTKLLFLSEKGMADLLAALKAKGVATPEMPRGVAYENAMLGFLTSMDGDNRWQGLAHGSNRPEGRAFFLASGGGQAWQNLFMRQIGERADWPANTAPTQDPLAPPDDAGFVLIESWAARVDKVEYDNDKGRKVRVTMTFRNDTNKDLVLANSLFQSVQASLGVDRNGVIPNLPMEYVHQDEASLPAWHYLPNSPIPPKGRITVRFIADVGDSVRQRLVGSITILEQRMTALMRTAPGTSKMFKLEQLNLDGSVGEQPAPTLPDLVTDPEALKKYEGRYRTNRGTIINLAVVDGELTGEAMTVTRPSPRERVKLKLYIDGALRGSMRDLDAGFRATWFDLNIRFSPDGQRFAGQGTYTHAVEMAPISYTGQRIGDAETPGAPRALPAGFTEAGFLALRADAVSRSTYGGVDRIDVSLTALNFDGGRKGVQYNDKSMVLITADGVERRWDGNYYGASSAERLVSTLWLEQDDQAQVTYVFNAPAGSTPARLSVRDGTREIASLDLTQVGASRARPAADAQKTEAAGAVGRPAVLGTFEATIDKLQQDAEGAWEALVTVRNITQSRQRLMIADLNMALYGADGQARHMNGNFYDYGSGPRRAVESGAIIGPGASYQLRLFFPQSVGMTPTRYRIRQGSGEAVEGAVTR